MNPLDKAEIGSTGVMVSRLGVGGAPFGSMSMWMSLSSVQ